MQPGVSTPFKELEQETCVLRRLSLARREELPPTDIAVTESKFILGT